jgi:xenotropic and polytropic retrovirus receptor 1
MPTLDLPDPALHPDSQQNTDAAVTARPLQTASRPSNEPPDPYHVVKDNVRKGSLARKMFSRRQNATQPSPITDKNQSFRRSKLRRMFSAHANSMPPGDDVQLEAYEKLDARQEEFFTFLDKELNKVEEFYKYKEDEANERLKVLRQQLHELRDHRLEEVRQLEHHSRTGTANGDASKGGDQHNLPLSKAKGYGLDALKPIGNLVSGKSKIGRVTKSLQNNTSPQLEGTNRTLDLPPDPNSDFVRRQQDAPSYRVAKRRLKLAMQEFYRGLELLKSYSLLNQTAFRKINKKYDKAINARPPLRYYSEYVQNAYFVKSDVIGTHMVNVEDLYSRYFEKGNHKIAVGKLRSKLKDGDFSDVSFRSGLWLASGTCLGAAGLANGLRLLFDSDPRTSVQTAYLLQLYGGYFLALLLGLMFLLNCKIWKANRINYAFVFEFDPRNMLDWRPLSELPCFFMLLLGGTMYVNFRHPEIDEFYRYWPIVLIGLTLAIMVLPFKVLYPYARKWWGYSNWRLLCAGLYPVEFRDFYLGDMYTSASYSMSQIALFFCLYAHDWNNPPQCNSNHSRLLGFFQALPAVLRALQCVRRFHDSGNWFPHMANFAKYCGNILYYTTLSVYRIDMSYQTRAAFITFALLNSLYCTIWDIFMDWSLGDWVSSNTLLRARLGYKRRRVYYAAIIGDIILRQQWIVYAIFVEDLQHSSAASFFVGLAEVFRRGMWSLFRVENEHCNNVDKFRASRDVPLPYKLAEAELHPAASSRSNFDHTAAGELQPPDGQADGTAATSTSADIERQRTSDTAVSSLRRRQAAANRTPTLRTLARVATIIAGAHSQDFEKRKKPADTPDGDEPADLDESSDEDDDEDGPERNGEVRPSVDVQNQEDIDEARRMIRDADREA